MPNTEVYKSFPIAKLQLSKSNPRHTRNPELLKDLAASIEEQGILEPLLVTPTGMVISGARRYMAAKIAKLTAVPCRVMELTEDEVRQVQLIENLQREDVHPLEEAQGFQRLIEHTKGDAEKAAAAVGKQKAYVLRRLKLLDLTEAAKAAFLAGEFGLDHAFLLCRLQPKQQASILKNERDMTAGDLQDLIHRQFMLELASATFDTQDAKLVPSAGPCTTCPKRTGNNPLLFPDVKAGDTCTDSLCFESKVQAHQERALVQIKTDTGKPGLKLSTRSYLGYGEKRPAGLLLADEYVTAKAASCEHVQKGVIIHTDNYGDDRKKLGKVLTVCAEKKCKTHFAFGGTRPKTHLSEDEMVRRRKRIADAKFDRVYNKAVLEDTLKRVDGQLDRQEMDLLAVALFSRVHHNQQQGVLKLYGWEKPKNSYGSLAEEFVAKKLKEMDDAGVVRFMITSHVMGFGGEFNDDELLAAAKIYGSDAEAIKRKLQAEAKAKKAEKDAKAKKAAAKPKAKGKAAGK